MPETSVRGGERSRLRPGAISGQTQVAVARDDGLAVGYSTEELLADILAQMKINNAHLALITGEDFDEPSD